MLNAIQRDIPSWLACAPQAVLLIHFRDITGLKELQEHIVHHLGGARANELRSLLRHKPLRLLVLDDLGGMDPGARGLAMRRWLRGLDDSAGTKLLMVSNERLNVLFRKDDPGRDSPLAGLDPTPIDLGPLSIETCRRIVARRRGAVLPGRKCVLRWHLGPGRGSAGGPTYGAQGSVRL